MKKKRNLAVVLTVALLLQMLPLPVGCLAAVWDAAGVSLAAKADGIASGSEGSITWTYADATHTLTLSGSGTMPGFNQGYYDYSIPQQPQYYNRTSASWGVHAHDAWHIVVGSGIQNVSQNAFYGFNVLESVSMPEVTAVDAYAFYKCSLQSVYMPKVEKIERWAFRECSSLKGTLSDASTDVKPIDLSQVMEIGEFAFYKCSSLTSVATTSVTATPDPAASVPTSKLTKIKESAFYGCTQLTGTIDFSNVTEIGPSAFYNCSKLAGPVEIPDDKLTEISASAFFGCTALQSVTIGKGVTTIGNNAFASSGLTSIAFPDSAKTVGTGILSNTQLTEVVWPASVKAITESAFQGCSQLKDIAVPDWVTGIGKKAFSGCANLAKVVISDQKDDSSVKTIGEEAFSECVQLKEVDFGQNVQSIGKSAFAGCTSLATLSLPPSSLKTIGEEGFSHTGLTKFTVPASVETIGTNPWVGGKLQEFAVDSGNQKYAVDNGMLVEKKDGSYAVISYPCEGDQTPTVSASVREIQKNAFRETKISGIKFSEGLETIGEYAFYQSTLGSLKTPESLRTIGKYAFANQEKEYTLPLVVDVNCLKSAVLSEGLETIGLGAFCGSALESLEIPGSLQTMESHAFARTNQLKSAVLSEGLKKIGENAFDGSALESLKTPESLRSIEDYAFLNTNRLKSVEFSEGLETIGRYAFHNSALESLKTPESLKVISWRAFEFTGHLKSVELSEGLETLEAYAFKDSALESVKFPKSLQEISDHAFYSTNNLKDAEFAEGLQAIGQSAFEGATALQRVELPGSLKTIKSYAFHGDTSLETVDAAGGKLETIEAYAFSGCTKLWEVLLGGELLNIGQSAFGSCKSIEEIALPDKMKTLGNNVFSGCSKLKAIDFPNSVTSIGSGVLSGCTALKRATFGSVIQEITGDVFENCPSITEITVSAKNPHMLAEDNIVYSRDRKKFIYYAAGLAEEKFSVPDGVQIIGNKSFTYCAYLKEIRFPDSVASLAKDAVYKNKYINKLFFSGNGPKTYVVDSGPVIEYPQQNLTVRTYTQYNGSITQNGASYNNQGLWVYALPGTTGWGKGWTEKTKEDTADTTVQTKYVWNSTYTFNDTDWNPDKTDVSHGDFGDLVWDYRDDVGELKFSGKGKIPDYTENNLPTWTDEDDVSQDHMQDIRLIKAGDAEAIEIGNNAFRGATGLRKILAGDHLTRIGEGAFAGCTSLVHVDTYCVERIEKEAFMGDTAIVDDLDVRNAVSLGEGAFKGCDALLGLLLGEKLKSIGAEAFSGCGALDTMVIPDSVTAIGERCFKGCASLRTVNIPKGLHAIPAESFADCDTLQKVYFYGDYPDAWAADSFANPNGDLKIYYRAGNGTWNNAGSDWSGIPLVAQDKFYTAQKDAYSFTDTRGAFGYKGKYYIPVQRYATALQSIPMGVYYQELDGLWRGSCFGMASSTMEFYDGDRLKVKDYDASATNVYDLSAPGSYNAGLTKAVEIYQVSQHADEIGLELYHHFGQYRVLIKQVEEFERSGGLSVDAKADPIVICVYTKYSGHALIPVAVNMDQAGNYILDVYDCSHPGEFRKLKIKKDFSGIEYEDAQENIVYNTASFVRYSTVRDVLEDADFTGQYLKTQKKGSKKVSVAVNQENVTLENGGGRDYTEIKNAYEQRLVAAEDEGKDSFGGIRSFVLPQGDYRMKAENIQGDLKYYAATEELFSKVETSDGDAQLTVKGYRGEGNDVIALSSEHADMETKLTVMDVHGVQKEISLKGSDVSVEMNSGKKMTVTVSEDAKDVKVDGEPITLQNNEAKISFVAAEGENPMEASQMQCEVFLDDQNRLSGEAETCLTWLKEKEDSVNVTAKFQNEEGDVIAEYEKKVKCEFGMQQVLLDFDKVKTNMKGLEGEIPVTCELKMVDSQGNVVRISQENIVLKKKAQQEEQDPTDTSEPTATPKPTGTPKPTDTPKPSMSQPPQASPAPGESDDSKTQLLGKTPKPTATAKPKTKKKPKGTLPKKGKVLTSGSLKYKVLKSAKKNGTVAVYGAKKKNASKVSIPNKVKIKGYSFKVTEIYQNAFKNMKKLSDVKIGENVTSIGNNAFRNCQKIRFIVIPKRVKKIGGKAFAGCRNLNQMLVKSDQIKSLGGKAFSGVASKVKVKTSKKKWRKYARMFRGKGRISSGALFVINPVKLKYKGKTY